jgi:hypothetical protein
VELNPPQLGITLDAGANTVYVFAASSPHSNELVIDVTNPTPNDVLWGPDSHFEILIPITTSADPAALTTLACAQNIQASVSGSPCTWTTETQQQDDHTWKIVLKPTGDVNAAIGYGAQAIVQIHLTGIVTLLAVPQTVVIQISANKFPDFGDASLSPPLVREACPTPSMTLAADQPSVAFAAPLRATWQVSFADTLVLTVNDGQGTVITRSLPASSAQWFLVLPNALCNTTLQLAATNDSNPGIYKPTAVTVPVAAAAFVHKFTVDMTAIDLPQSVPTNVTWSVAPACFIDTVNWTSGGQTVHHATEASGIASFNLVDTACRSRSPRRRALAGLSPRR